MQYIESITRQESGAGAELASFRTARLGSAARAAHMSSSVGARWTVPWSDLMLTMFVLFVVLYLVERGRHNDVLVPAKVAPTAVASNLPEVSDRLNTTNVVLDAELGMIDGIELTLGVTPRIALTGDLLFETGTAEIRPEIFPVLSRVAEVIRQAPPHLDVVRVAGHADDRPMHSDRYPSNWELSSARASAVARALIEEFSLDGERFVVSAHAHHRPREGPGGVDSHARNRRVEISLSPAEFETAGRS